MKNCPNNIICPLGSITESGMCVYSQEDNYDEICPILNMKIELDLDKYVNGIQPFVES